ncbi:Pre protein translocase subunit Sec66-domain-containing protein [Staphylotrichum tortipilum]|uniref:Pre protein translocase subunit Sec66-domain-containing protein n=1 Tax=Staphylotrichum tortipilum TaxID=2831512 RepID=A0AAN6RT38_9PEZI|nr:Pre protein translocase subunit Sec66-domain-containing protein [Staphylotrichum longicolle]
MFDINWGGLLLPLAYLVVLVGTFMTFSRVYRKRKAIESANLAPWFGPHLQRNVYLSLLHMEPEEGSDKAPKVPETVIRAALLRRAVEDIRRIIQIRTAKTACSSLLQRGSVGDDLWQRFLRAEKEMEEELRDVVMEANALLPGWGQIIFQSANEIAANKVLRDRLEEIEVQLEHDKEWWDKRRGDVKTDPTPKDQQQPADDEASEKGLAKAGSEDEPVLVETADTPSAAATPAATPPATPQGGSKKKKGRK